MYIFYILIKIENILVHNTVFCAELFFQRYNLEVPSSHKHTMESNEYEIFKNCCFVTFYIIIRM